MSKYLTYAEIEFRDRGLLIESIKAMGYKVDLSSVFGGGLQLQGYRGQTADCEIVIRRHKVDYTYNGSVHPNYAMCGDIGFQRTANGYMLIIDETDHQGLRGGDGHFLRDLRVEYNGRVAQTIARRLSGQTSVKTEGQLVKYAIAF